MQPAVRAILLGAAPVRPVFSAIVGNTFDSRVTYTGASLKMDVDATGKLTYGPNNVALQSNTVTNAGWSASSGTKTTGQADPWGGTNAALYAADGTSNSHNILAPAISWGPGWTIIISQYVKPGTATLVQLASSFTGIGTGFYVNFSLTGSGSVVGQGSVTASGISYDAATGYYRIWAKGTTIGSVSEYASVLSIITANGDTRAPTNSSAGTVTTTGIQIEYVTYETTPRAYNATTASAYLGPRFGYDPVTLAPLGYLSEEPRTNLELQSAISNATWSKSNATITASGTAPDGSSSSLITATASPAVIFNTSTIAVSASTTYAVSFYMKPGTTDWGYIQINLTGAAGAIAQYFNLTTGVVGATEVLVAGITVVGAYIDPKPVQGHYRGIVVITTPAGTTAIDTYVGPTNANSSRTVTVGKTISAWGADVEATSANYPGPTSYIPTTSATVTRAADVASITGSNFSGFYNQGAGTWALTVTGPGNYDTKAFYLNVYQGGGDHIQIGRREVTGNSLGKRLMSYIFTGSSLVATFISGADDIGATTKLALGYATNDAAFANAGTLVGTDTSLTLPVPTEINIGSYQGSQQWCNCHIGKLDYYNVRLPNDKSQGLTQ